MILICNKVGFVVKILISSEDLDFKILTCNKVDFMMILT